MGLSTVDGDLYVRGTFRAGTVTLPNSSVGNTQINPSDPIAATKLDHQYCPVFRQAHGTAAAAERLFGGGIADGGRLVVIGGRDAALICLCTLGCVTAAALFAARAAQRLDPASVLREWS